MAEPASSGSFNDLNIVGKPAGHHVDESSHQSPDHGHRRGHSEVCTPSHLNSHSLQQTYPGSGVQYRERRSVSWDVSNDPDLRRKKRLASYKVFTLEGKVKSTVKKSFRWVKGKCQGIVYGFK